MDIRSPKPHTVELIAANGRSFLLENAYNVQVNGFPAVIDGEPYPIYFELEFGDGAWWEVEFWGTEIVVEIVDRFHRLSVKRFPNWERFLKHYLGIRWGMTIN